MDHHHYQSLQGAVATMALLCLVLSPAAEAVPSSLWVFGDSYADTGNLGDLGRELTHAWYDPYGLTFPGHPTGRFSDGRTLTDFIASAMGVPTPVAYKLRRGASRRVLPRGMNFAVGGAGVLDTGNFQRNISAQIDLFQAQHRPAAPDAGIAVVVVSGNDYSYAADKGNSTNAAIAYIPTVVRQLREQLRRLRDEVGMRKVVVTNLHPMGCTPLFTRALNYSGCDPLANMGAVQHNAALQSVLAALDPANRTFLLLDLNAPFAALVDSPSPESSRVGRFAEPRRPCCESLSADGYCGQQDEDGKRQYTLCSDPGEHFYWDDVHPTQAAWAAVAQTFRPKIHDFLSA
ncbi:GDSL esterase/lipase At5g03610-like [Phragmites australis]|uniref:GDSL esterase/lipase At5g03610-like n=1 Tax=Phragmites australis TaxID=29695 RepID=UPI002D77FF46|nr:GDSL esterase/lipase At5g03610-like [Phragmites australis]